jgi:hypothetical protein
MSPLLWWARGLLAPASDAWLPYSWKALLGPSRTGPHNAPANQCSLNPCPSPSVIRFGDTVLLPGVPKAQAISWLLGLKSPFHKPELYKVVQWENEFTPNYPIPFAISVMWHLTLGSNAEWTSSLPILACISAARYLQSGHLATDTLKTLVLSQTGGTKALRG